MKHILDKIKEFDKIVILGHIRPDGDCIGSQYGLMYLIKETFPNKLVYITGSSSDYVSFIGKPTIIDDNYFLNALCIVVDCPVKNRLSDDRINLAKYSIKIDHHFDNEKYCDYEYVDPTSASCTQIIGEFYMKYKDELKMNTLSATALYTGLITDTGNFKYSSVSTNTFVVAAELLKHNIDLTYINNCLSIESESALRLKGYCLSKFKITPNGFAYITLSKDEFEKFNVGLEVASSLVSSISNIENCPVWALIIETENGIRVRLRSRSIKINDIAEQFNGGGHIMAAGATLEYWSELDKLISMVDDKLEKNK